METLESLGKRISTTKDLQSIVRSMKSLAAVSVRQYERMAIAQSDYNRTIEYGLQILLREAPLLVDKASPVGGRTVAIVFGSDHGLCGRFNEQISQFARKEMHRCAPDARERIYFAIGVQPAIRLESLGERIDAQMNLPGSPSGLAAVARDILVRVDAWQGDMGVERVLLFRSIRTADTTASPTMIQLLPLDVQWLQELSERPWPSPVLPTHSMDRDALLASLIREHLFASIFRAAAESMASEHATRLASMQAAERNIKERLEEMGSAFRRQRQEAITAELLDLVAGYETLKPTSPDDTTKV